MGQTKKANPVFWGIQMASLSVLCALVYLSVHWWGLIPEAKLLQGGAGGTPEVWSGPRFLGWFALPILGVALTLFFQLFQFLRPLAQRHPWLVSLPRKKTFLELPDESKAAVLDIAIGRLPMLSVPAVSYLIYGQWVQFQLALGETVTISVPAMIGFVVVSAGVLLLYFFWVDRAIRAEAG